MKLTDGVQELTYIKAQFGHHRQVSAERPGPSTLRVARVARAHQCRLPALRSRPLIYVYLQSRPLIYVYSAVSPPDIRVFRARPFASPALPERTSAVYQLCGLAPSYTYIQARVIYVFSVSPPHIRIFCGLAPSYTYIPLRPFASPERTSAVYQLCGLAPPYTYIQC